jgi:hypothetical protein
LVRKFSLAEERNPILYFPGKSWPAAGGGIAGIGSVHFFECHHRYLTTKIVLAQTNITINIYEQK